MSHNRRKFVQASLAFGALSTTAQRYASATAEESLPIIDTHQHLWDLVQFSPPWLKGADAKIAAKHDLNDYVKETQGLNIVKAIYMEIDVAPEDQNKEADYVLGLIQSGKTSTVAAVISGRPDSEKFASYMARFRDNSKIKGIRQVLHAESAERGLCLKPQFVKSVQLLGEMNKTFDLCMRPTELADGAALAEKCPNTRFILDHCGNADPQAWRAKDKQTAKPIHEVDQWKRDLQKLAKRENVICKISGIIARAPKDWSAEDLAPAVNHCLDEFGPDRVVFGGDWPVCKLGATYVQWVQALKTIIANRPLADQKKLLHDNAAKFYGVA